MRRPRHRRPRRLAGAARRPTHGVEVVGYWGEAVTTAGGGASAASTTTGARGLAGDLFVDGALGSRTAWLQPSPTPTPRTAAATGYLDADAIAAHLRACTAGRGHRRLPRHRRRRGRRRRGRPRTRRRPLRRHRGRTLRAPAGTPGDGRPPSRPPSSARGASIASVQPNFDALWGGAHGMYAQRLGAARAAELNPLALLASQGVPLAFGSDSPVTGMTRGRRSAPRSTTARPAARVSARAAFSAATRGAWRAAGVRDGVTGTLVAGRPGVLCGVGHRRSRGRRAGATPCSAGPPTRAPGCPRCRDSSRRPAAPVPDRRCIGVSSSMADGDRTMRLTARPAVDAASSTDPDGGGRARGRAGGCPMSRASASRQVPARWCRSCGRRYA